MVVVEEVSMVARESRALAASPEGVSCSIELADDYRARRSRTRREGLKFRAHVYRNILIVLGAMVAIVAPNGPVSDIQNLLGDFMVLAQQALKRTGGGWGSICHFGVLFPARGQVTICCKEELTSLETFGFDPAARRLTLATRPLQKHFACRQIFTATHQFDIGVLIQ
jgi:hypothetical protein